MFEEFYDLTDYRRRIFFGESDFGNAEFFYNDFSDRVSIAGNSIILSYLDKNGAKKYIDIGEIGLEYCIGLMLKKLNETANYNAKDRYVPSLENIKSTVEVIKIIYTMKQLQMIWESE